MMTTETTEKRFTGEPPFITRIRLYAQRRVLWLRSLWTDELMGVEGNLVISHQTVDRILTGSAQTIAAEIDFYASDRNAQGLTEQIHQVEEWVAQDRKWQRLQQAFGLSEFESDLLALAIAVEIEPELQRVYGYLQDDATMGYATPWLAASLFLHHQPERLGSDSALVRWRLAFPQDMVRQPWSLIAAWVADPPIVSWLVQGLSPDPVLGTAVHWMPAASAAHQTCLYSELLKQMQEFLEALTNASHPAAASAPVELELIGPVGAGKRSLAGQLCAGLGMDVLVADASLLLGVDLSLSQSSDRVLRTVRLAGLSGTALYWHAAEEVKPQVWQSVQAYCPLVLFGGTAPLAHQSHRAVHRTFRLPQLTREQRIYLWQQSSDQPVPTPVADWMLTPAEIVAAARVAPAGTEAVEAVCRQMLYREPGELFAPLPCPYTWKDIVLQPAIQQHLEELEAQAKYRWAVYEEWGFERLCPLGRGITALFAGPSGTGKTMAAQVLARSLGMELYRVDLAGVVNKYIGETEKRLKRVFDACERSNVLLFFDEADALFGQRTQVKDAHDRFANIEIDYLLQRMEQFDGMAILATNRKGDLDQAFLRRIRFIVDFVQPGVAERLALWKLALQERSPFGEELLDAIDWEFLANKLTMTGADIKLAALNAAFLARSQDTRITMPHILHAARREMTKHGMVIRPGEWES